MLADKRAILQCLGCLIKCPALFEEYKLEQADFEVEPFYEIIFSCIYNLYVQGVDVINSFAIDSFLSNYEKQYKIFEDNYGIEYCDDAVALADLSNFFYYFNRLKKFSLLRYYANSGADISFIYDPNVVDPSLQEKEMEKLDKLSIEEIINTVEGTYVTTPRIRFMHDETSRGQLAGKGMAALKEKLKEEPEFGLPMQSPIMTTIARGARLGKIYMRSASSGAGKTRLAVADLCNMSIPWKYDGEKKKWCYTGICEASLFISTELDEEEVQTLIMAYVSGVPEDHIIDGRYEGDEELRVDEAIQYIESSPLYIEIINDFGIQDIVDIIKKYKREKGCLYFVFDYIHMSAKLIAEVSTMTKGVRLREDQILFLFIDTLKNLCAKLGIFILTMSQLNGTYKDSPIKDETMLRGAKNMADRLDLGEITLPPTKAELDNVKELMKHFVGMKTPNLVHHVYKVRRGKLTRIRLWQYADLGQCRTTDLFVTTNDYELIPVNSTQIDMEEIVDAHSVDAESVELDKEESIQKLFDW